MSTMSVNGFNPIIFFRNIAKIGTIGSATESNKAIIYVSLFSLIMSASFVNSKLSSVDFHFGKIFFRNRRKVASSI